jgi:hypothetical protein
MLEDEAVYELPQLMSEDEMGYEEAPPHAAHS